MDKQRLKELALSTSKQKRKDSHPPGYRNIAESLSIEERYIAALDPETVLALLEENERLRAQINEAVGVLIVDRSPLTEEDKRVGEEMIQRYEDSERSGGA